MEENNLNVIFRFNIILQTAVPKEGADPWSSKKFCHFPEDFPKFQRNICAGVHFQICCRNLSWTISSQCYISITLWKYQKTWRAFRWYRNKTLRTNKSKYTKSLMISLKICKIRTINSARNSVLRCSKNFLSVQIKITETDSFFSKPEGPVLRFY